MPHKPVGKGAFLGSGGWVCSGPASELGSSGTNYSLYLFPCLDYSILSLQWDGRKRLTRCLLWYILCLLNFLGKWKCLKVCTHLSYTYVLQKHLQIPLTSSLMWLLRALHPVLCVPPGCPPCTNDMQKLFGDHFSKQGVKITYSWDPLTMKISNYFPVSRETLTEIISDILIVDQQRVIQFSSP